MWKVLAWVGGLILAMFVCYVLSVGGGGRSTSDPFDSIESGSADPRLPELPQVGEGLPNTDAISAGSGVEAPAEMEELEEAPAAEPEVVDGPDIEFVALQAGEINDNETFGEYLRYREAFEQSGWEQYTWEADIQERHVISVETPDGLPILGAEVLIESEQEEVAVLTTPATGTVYFFPRAYDFGLRPEQYRVTVSKGQADTTFTIAGGQSDEYDIVLGAPPTEQEVELDVLFLLDSTGSMGDEIDQLKDNIRSISAQLEALPANPDVRFGMVTYRDRGDEYVTRNFNFTSDVEAFQDALRDVEASGGGDVPESLNEGLHEAVSDVDWRGPATVKLIFLVSDAPPHLDYAQDYDYIVEMKRAAEQGIKIHMIASSGLESEGPHGEYIYRQIAQFTGGNFIFLTYDSTPRGDQQPGRDVSVPEQNYAVEDLDALVVRLIVEELEALRDPR